MTTKDEGLTMKAVREAFVKLKKLKPDMFPDTIIQMPLEHWKKHYPELFVEEKDDNE